MALPLSSSSTPSLSFTATPSKSLSCTLSPPNSTRFLTRRRFLSLKAMLTTVDSPSAADAGSGSPKVLLEVKNLRAVVAESRQEILRGVNLTINEDEVHAIMGKNGSGKSTFSKGIMDTINSLMVLDQPTLFGSVVDLDSQENDSLAFGQ